MGSGPDLRLDGEDTVPDPDLYLNGHHEERKKIKDATKKFLALARHLLSFYPGTHAKGDAAAKGTGKKK